jgi:hypothetical protein
MSKLYVTKNNRRYERKRDKITISLTHAPSTVFSTTQLVLEFHIGGTGVSLMWYWQRTCMIAFEFHISFNTIFNHSYII